MHSQPNPQGATLAECAGWRDSASLPSSADAALTLLQEQEVAAFVPLFGPNPMTESPPNTVMVPVPPIPAALPPADLPAPTLFPGVWVLHRADGALCALLATYCDDLLILGIGEDAAATIDPFKDIVTCGDYTDLSGDRFVGVQFDVSTTGVFCYQHDYIASLVLPPDMASSDRHADKPLPVGSTHEDDTSPLLFAAGVKVFRTLLGQVGYVASYTRPDVALVYSYLSYFLASPTERALRLLLQTVRYLRSHPFLRIHVRPSSDPTELTAIEHGDSSFGNTASPHPQTGWVVFINNSPLI
uniref:Reverse transcriptase Ty1/copia-type domain-containing protein n=1 Tax=Chromera velia CCMP2878 TaxID=1169474 RepID=A0A0G4HQW8_9ALVE|eukprot:Cvel_1255.t1-p1 / transcript=Cvel_1255.t1 / gene=Cvel_1255 / organism=Chromera_velia_CCMP2878 / gene_product=hypothetical protein / transcript_product=hypothetical protein / location=Cvel_scaffold42:43200-45230(+) / protein_length=299 / sequence_SO=supercontig / SO=protein_coding / is_pseudo=false